MNSQVLISVVVPCYRVEQYLEKCVNSILVSSFEDYEIILVDDGSPDRTGVIADELAKRDSRIRVIHRQNGGVIKARETGVDAAMGEWITLVDSDDSITPNALEDLYNASLVNDTDIVIGYPVGKKYLVLPDHYDIQQYRFDTISGTRIHAAPWGRLIRRSIITSFMFGIPREVRLGEDMLFNIRCAFATDKDPIVINSYVYDYFKNVEGAVHTNKRNPEGEQLFHKMRLASIPVEEHEKYMSAMILDRFHPILWWSYQNPFDTSWMESEFVANLKRDIQNSHCFLDKKSKTLLYQRNKWLRFIIIGYYRLLAYIRK